MTTAATGQQQSLQVAGLNVQYWEGGTGEPLLILHQDTGISGWEPFHAALASRYRVLVPELPGYGKSDRPVWARHPRDLALLLGLFLDKLGVERVTLVGLGFGGWLAAEMAVMNQRRFARLVLVNAAGIRPSEGQITDQMMMDLQDYAEAGCADQDSFTRLFGEKLDPDVRLRMDYAREMTARVAWKPYMFSHQLPHLLGSVETPALVVWGRENRVMPLVCGEAFARALPNAKLEIVDGAGQWVDLEQPEKLAELITAHAA